MKRALACLVLFAAPAAAEPSTRCAVTIARAPDDVRAVVEHWVSAEPRCGTSLDVRIVPTDGGLYVLARDDRGGVRERIVPDAQSAGVLIASWSANDDVRAPVDTTPPPAVPPESISDREMPMPPGLAPAIIAQAAPPERLRKSWSAGGTMLLQDGGNGGGVRGELDVMRLTRWSMLGLAASVSRSGQRLDGATASGRLDALDSRLLAYAAAVARFGKWQLRTTAGIGLIYTRANVTVYEVSAGWNNEVQFASPMAQASLAIAREVGSRWLIEAGPVVSANPQRYAFIHDTMPVEVQRSVLELSLFAGARRRL